MTRKNRPLSNAQQLVVKLTTAILLLNRILPAGLKNLPVLTGLTARDYVEPQVAVLQKAAELLRDSRRVFRLEDQIVMEVTQLIGQGQRLVSLMNGGEVSQSAVALFSNLLVLQTGDRTIPIPTWFAGHLLHSELVRKTLPMINYYGLRPVFDQDYNLCSSGWNQDAGILVHGPEVEPDLNDYSQAGPNSVDRLPPYLRKLLGQFCFTSPADLANLLGMMLTGLLVNHFSDVQKGLCIVDGNQPGLGKTLLVRCVGVVNDGVDPTLVPYTSNDDELAKRICADLRQRRQSVVIVDNAKLGRGKEVSSPCLEANAVAPVISLRILGQSLNHVQRNDLLWFLSMNHTKASQDLLSRSVVVQLYHEGDPKTRNFEGFDPIRFARENRLKILGELAGFVIRWNQQGRPPGLQQHRLHEWARILGGILTVAGFPEFLTNANQVSGTFSSELEKLADLAEVALRQTLVAPTIDPSVSVIITPKLPAREWESLFAKIGLLTEDLHGKSERSKAIKIGQFFSPYLDRGVEIELFGSAGKATLKQENGRAKTKLYFFEFTPNPTPDAVTLEPMDSQPEILQVLVPSSNQQPDGFSA